MSQPCAPNSLSSVNGESPYRIRLAQLDDLPALGVIAPAAYSEAYGSYWDDPAAYSNHLATFSSDAFAALLRQSDAYVWVACNDAAIVGFATMFLNSPHPANSRANGAELRRIYILQPAHGRGIGRRFLDVAKYTALSQQQDHLWLDVMSSADWAVHAYRKWGFNPIGNANFPGGVIAEKSGMTIMSMDI